MKIILILCGLYVCTFGSDAGAKNNNNLPDDKKFPSLFSSGESVAANKLVDSLYKKIHLDSFGLQRTVFFNAYKGYEYLLSKNMLEKKEILTICDYSQPSSSKRLYVIDLARGELLFNTYVSHGRNSGDDLASSFSNLNKSHKSSLGFMVTAETYRGKAGYSLRFDGVEPGINDNVRMRDIVMHGSRYVTGKRVDKGQMMGRSFGCPAVPYKEHKTIIDEIKNGSCFFAYYPDDWYQHNSQVLNAHFSWPALAPAGMIDIASLQKPPFNIPAAPEEIGAGTK